MRKLLMLATMALAALAVMAPSASAYDYPHGDSNPENWESVEAETTQGDPCSLNGGCLVDTHTASQWYWEFDNGVNTYGSYECTLRLSGGTVDDYGFVEFSDPVMNDMGSYENNFCRAMKAADTETGTIPWIGNVCRHIPTGEVWLKLLTGLEERFQESRYWFGYSFAQLVGPSNQDGGVDPESIVFDGEFVGDIWYDAVRHTGSLDLTTSSDVSFVPGGSMDCFDSA